MPLKSFSHVNVLTDNVDGMIEWYDRILGLKAGPRPNFGFPGAWLYLGDLALIHLVGVDEAPKEAGRIEHFAIEAEGLDEFRALLSAENVPWKEAVLEDVGILQINIHDPDGNHIHIDFDVST